MAVFVVVIGEDRKHSLVLLDKKCRRAMRELFVNARHCGTDSADAFELCVAAFAASFPLIELYHLLRAELCDAFDQSNGNQLGEREPDRAFAALITGKFFFES